MAGIAAMVIEVTILAAFCVIYVANASLDGEAGPMIAKASFEESAGVQAAAAP